MRALIPMLVLAIGLPAASVPAAAQDDEEHRYLLPAPAGQALEATTGSSRRGDDRSAIFFQAAAPPASDLDDPDGAIDADIDIDEDFTVVAARGGTVIGQRSSVPDGRCPRRASGARPDCWRQVNYVLIDHGDGTSGLYMHLRRGSTFVRRGDIVSVGTPLGVAGRSGWTSDIGVRFQVQRTPARGDVGQPGWFVTRAMPASFADPSVVEQRPSGILRGGDVVVSANELADRAPFRLRRRPVDLPAVVPLTSRDSRVITSAYDPDSPDGWGLSFRALSDPVSPGMPSPGVEVRPVFGGELVYAGCATGRSASLGLSVIVRAQLDDADYLGVHGHLTDISPALLATDADEPIVVEPGQLIGHYGGVDEEGHPVQPCVEADLDATAEGVDATADDTDGTADEVALAERNLFVSILQDALVSPEGEISAETPISPEPLRGRGGYEGFMWWRGPVEGVRVGDAPGRPRASWTADATRSGAHVRFGAPVVFAARVRDSADIAEVRFRVYYPEWARPGAALLDGFDPRTTWRQVAVCRPPGSSGVPPRTRGCDWDGDANDAIVRYSWLPTEAGVQPAAPWLPRARIAITAADEACVPLSLAVEVIDTSGHARALDGTLPLPSRCDDPAAQSVEGARLVYLDPLVPPATPGTRGAIGIRAVPPVEPDPLDGNVVWRDLANNEDGYRIYARRQWYDDDCDLVTGPYVLVDALPADTRRYRPRHNRILRMAPIPASAEEGPGSIAQYRLYVSAYNQAGESPRVFVGGFFVGLDAFCDEGLPGPDAP